MKLFWVSKCIYPKCNIWQCSSFHSDFCLPTATFIVCNVHLSGILVLLIDRTCIHINVNTKYKYVTGNNKINAWKQEANHILWSWLCLSSNIIRIAIHFTMPSFSFSSSLFLHLPLAQYLWFCITMTQFFVAIFTLRSHCFLHIYRLLRWWFALRAINLTQSNFFNCNTTMVGLCLFISGLSSTFFFVRSLDCPNLKTGDKLSFSKNAYENHVCAE